MILDQAFSELIGRIYDCALDKDHWPAVLGELCEALDAKFGDLSVMDGVSGTMQVQVSHGWAPERIERMMRHSHLNPAAPLGLIHPLGEPWCGSRHMGVEQIRRSLYWRSCMEGAGTLDLLAVPLSRKVTQIGVWEVTGAEERGLFSDADIDFARMVAPHIRRAVEISGVIRQQDLVETTLQKMLERLGAGAMIVTADATIRFCNEAARIELRDGSFLREAKGHLTATHPEASRLLAGLFHALGRSQHGHDVVMSNGRGRELHLTWARLDRAEEEVDAPFLLLLRPPEPDLLTPLSMAVDIYGLTGAEAQTLAQVLEGRSLEEASAVLGVARSTVKTHLNAIFAKSGARRQTELVSRVMGLVTTVR